MLGESLALKGVSAGLEQVKLSVVARLLEPDRNAFQRGLGPAGLQERLRVLVGDRPVLRVRGCGVPEARDRR